MSTKGTYVLILQLKKSAKLQIGKLGCFDFKRGYYAYVGSAFGPGGLAARLKHHLTLSANPHWHIDYLRKTAPVIETWVYSSQTKYEHEWAENLYHLRCVVFTKKHRGRNIECLERSSAYRRCEQVQNAFP